MSDHIHVDFETYSVIDLKKVGAEVYADHESTGAWCMGYAIGDGPVEMWKKGEAFPDAITEATAKGMTLVAHNAAFEIAIWNKAMAKRHGWPAVSPSLFECTAAMAYAMALPGSLEKAAAATGIKQQKDMQGSRIMMQLCRPREVAPDGHVIWWNDSEKFEKLYAYCKQDIEVERELYKRLRKLSASERQVWILDQRINQRGVQCDVEAVKTAIEIVKLEKVRLDKEMNKVTGNAVATCTATAQLSDWIKSQGVDVDGVAKADVVDLLSRRGLPDSVRRALHLRQEAAKSSTAKLQAMIERAGDDGRIRGIFQYHGASTGRWAGRGIQPQNFPRPRISQEEIEEVFGILKRVND